MTKWGRRAHYLKTHPASFRAVRRGLKTHEIRKDDRGFEVGDILVLEEWDPGANLLHGAYTSARVVVVLVTCKTRGTFGLPADLCVLSIRRWAAPRWLESKLRERRASRRA